MKVNIWIHKDDIINDRITKHHYQCPQPNYQSYVQVEITQEEFVRLEDKRTEFGACIDGPGEKIEWQRKEN
jgi:hypothetical protein